MSEISIPLMTLLILCSVLYLCQVGKWCLE